MVHVREFRRKQWQNGKTVTVAAHIRADRSHKITSRKGDTIDMAEDISHQVEIAFLKIKQSKALLAEAWDLINSIPKRVP